jgi:hypothetical protein
MRLEEIKLALREGLPFEITTAAGDKFRVSESNQIAYADKVAALFVMTDDGLGHIIPLLTITSVTYLDSTRSKRRKK